MADGPGPLPPQAGRARFRRVAASALLVAAGLASSAGGGSARPGAVAGPEGFLDSLEARTFRWFWDLAHPGTGLTPDRWPTRSFASIGATGFALTAYPVGAERGWVTRAQATARVRATLRFLWSARQGAAPRGCAGYQGFFYHFLDPASDTRYESVELSTMDTALLMAGVLFCQSYFDRRGEEDIRALAESLYARVDWRWAQARPPTLVLGWTPERGFLPYDWRGYNEALLLHVLALGSPRRPPGPGLWEAWTKGYRWGTFHGYEHLGFAPLFGHQYAHVWIDFRGIQDATMRGRGIDYFENSRRATLAQRAYAVANPGGWAGYGERLWGLTACDGPVDRALEIGGRERRFRTYWARGASFTEVSDDGTVSPSAAAGSIAFAPEAVLPTLLAMRGDFGDRAWNAYGFVDALNPTLKLDVPVRHGRVDTARGWFDTDQLGIDQGPILGMIENHRSGLIWRVMRRNPHVVRGLRAAGFRGGWLDAAGERP